MLYIWVDFLQLFYIYVFWLVVILKTYLISIKTKTEVIYVFWLTMPGFRKSRNFFILLRIILFLKFIIQIILITALFISVFIEFMKGIDSFLC